MRERRDGPCEGQCGRSRGGGPSGSQELGPQGGRAWQRRGACVWRSAAGRACRTSANPALSTRQPLSHALQPVLTAVWTGTHTSV